MQGAFFLKLQWPINPARLWDAEAEAPGENRAVRENMQTFTPVLFMIIIKIFSQV